MEELTARRIFIMALIEEYVAKGLGNCQNVATLKKELAQINFDRYKDKYPAYLFFSDEQFNDVVKRNKLVVSDISSYTGYIPDECFEAIQKENIAENDIRENSFSIKIESDEASNSNQYTSTVPQSVFEYLKKANKQEIIHYIATQLKTSDYDIEWKLCRTIYSSISDELFSIAKLFVYGSLKSKNDGLYIAAPKTSMNIPKKIIEKLSLVSIAHGKPKDPIVFRYVKDGILVITFWK
jgi:hypothetical protein